MASFLRATLRAAASAAFAGAVLSAAACGGESQGTGGGGASNASSSSTGSGGHALVPSGFACSGQKVDYETEVAPYLGQHCGGVEGCHIPMHTPTGAYKLIVNQVADECEDGRLKVAPNDPENSYVIHKMTNTNLCSGTAMPKNVTGWIEQPEAQIQLVYDWICQGAQD